MIDPTNPGAGVIPFHRRIFDVSSVTTALGRSRNAAVYAQDSSLEVSWVRVALSGGGLTGTRVLPWWPPGLEGLSIDYPDDWERLERLVDSGEAALPEIDRDPAGDPVAR